MIDKHGTIRGGTTDLAWSGEGHGKKSVCSLRMTPNFYSDRVFGY